MRDEIAARKKIAAFARRRFVWLPIILHLAISLPLARVLNIWMDEASTLYTTRHGFFDALSGACADERQAPLYFLVLSVWRMFGDSILFARIFSVLISAAAIFFFHRLARKFLDEFAAGFIAVLFAIHPYLIWASVEIRVYSTVILFSVLLLDFFAAAYLKNEISDKITDSQKKSQFFYLLTAVLALYTNYYLGFLLFGGFAALIVLRRIETARRYFLQMLAVGACILPLLWIIKQQFAINTSGFAAEKSIAEGLRILSNHVYTLTFPIEGAPDGTPSLITALRIWFVRVSFVAVIFFLVKDKFRAVNEKVLLFGTLTTVVVAFLLTAYFLLGAPYIAFRHVAVLFVPLVLFLSVLLTSVLPRSFLIVFAVALALLFPYSKIYKQYPTFAKRGDWARVARFIEENEKPNQPIVVFQNYDALSLPFYYKGQNQVLPNEKFFDWNAEDLLSSEKAYADQTAFVISKIPPGAPEIWLATEESCQTPETAAACRPLENFLEANYTVIETKDFYLERLRLLRKK